jgi:adenosylmethionine-8-amino-7-oxononanoate aminotransferase
MTSSVNFDRLWMPFTAWDDMVAHPPLVITRASGLYLYTDDGRQYIDAIGSWWVSLFGHGHPHITGAVREQLEKLEHVMMAGCIAEPTLRLSDLLAQLLPPGLSRIFFSDNGSTAVEVAMKMALQYHALRGSDSRREFIALGGGYHGDTLGAMTVGNIAQYHGLFHERFKKALFTDPPYCYRCPCGKEPLTCSAECMDSLERLLTEHRRNIAAVIFEPMVQGAAGMRIYPAKVLERLFTLCRRHGVLTIADEVAMGFGRTGKMFACDHAGAVPDILCLAKGLTGGYLPLAATVVNEEFFATFKGDCFSARTFEHGHTFTGNALASAAGCAAMELLIEHRIPQSLDVLSEQLARGLQTFQRFEIVGDIRVLGTIGAIELVADPATRQRLPAEKRIAFNLCRAALRRGLLLRPLGDVVYFMLPYITTQEQLDTMLNITREAFLEIIDDYHSPA